MPNSVDLGNQLGVTLASTGIVLIGLGGHVVGDVVSVAQHLVVSCSLLQTGFANPEALLSLQTRRLGPPLATPILNFANERGDLYETGLQNIL